MKLYAKLQSQLRAGIRDALRRYKTVRRAADVLGMPKSSLHDIAKKHAIKIPKARRCA